MDAGKIKLTWQMRVIGHVAGECLRGDAIFKLSLASNEGNVTNDANNVCVNARCEPNADLDAERKAMTEVTWYRCQPRRRSTVRVKLHLHDNCHNCPSPSPAQWCEKRKVCPASTQLGPCASRRFCVTWASASTYRDR
jgi:hypothetical protein